MVPGGGLGALVWLRIGPVRAGGRNADSPAGEALEAARRVTLKGHLHPQRGRSDVVSAARGPGKAGRKT